MCATRRCSTRAALRAEWERTDLLLRIVQAGALAEAHTIEPQFVVELLDGLVVRLEAIEVCMERPQHCNHAHHAQPDHDTRAITPGRRDRSAASRIGTVTEPSEACRIMPHVDVSTPSSTSCRRHSRRASSRSSTVS